MFAIHRLAAGDVAVLDLVGRCVGRWLRHSRAGVRSITIRQAGAHIRCAYGRLIERGADRDHPKRPVWKLLQRRAARHQIRRQATAHAFAFV
jgi:hypothetical protein